MNVNRWRNFGNMEMFIRGDKEKAKDLFLMGCQDAIINISELHDFLKC